MSHNIPNYRDIYRIKNLRGTPEDECYCEYCHVKLDDDNRSKISKMVICLEWMIYQACKGCRQRFYGKADDAQMLKWAYGIAKQKRGEKNGKK